MTELFNPFNESPNHFRNSSEGPGATVASSLDGVGLMLTAAGLAACTVDAGRAAAAAEATAGTLGAAFAAGVAAVAGRVPARAAAAVLPFEPTVVQALPG